MYEPKDTVISRFLDLRGLNTEMGKKRAHPLEIDSKRPRAECQTRSNVKSLQSGCDAGFGEAGVRESSDDVKFNEVW